MALGEFLRVLERAGELHRTRVPIDPNLELTEVAVRAQREGKPALLIEHPRGSGVPLVVNHFASMRRIELALGRHPGTIGRELIAFLDAAFPPTLRSLIDHLPVIRRIARGRIRRVAHGSSQEIVAPPSLNALPIQTCWPGDGGRFITYGQVITADPSTRRRNIGIYRMHVFDDATTGMHWQIQKGGGFHYHRAESLGRGLDVAVALGTSPELLLASVAALPEGIDEAMFAGFLSGRRVEFVRAKSVALDVPASAEFILEGMVPAGERRLEGPFGDHFGHYSAAAEFPVFHLRAVTQRRGAVYPAIVVGKPPMEDKFLGDATQEMLGPLARLIHREVAGLWAYYEAGFHNLLVVAIEQRYQKEAMKAALGLMGTDQLSLTKCIITVSPEVDIRDFSAVLREVRAHFDPHFDFVMIPKVPLDTLDFTGPKMNLGSKMIIDATPKPGRTASARPQVFPEAAEIERGIQRLDSRITGCRLVEETLLLVRVASGGREIAARLVVEPLLAGVPLLAAVSEDVDIHDRESYIWGVFTRFDCERDVFFTTTRLEGIAPIYGGTLGIDATWKSGYPAPLAMDEAVTQRVDGAWGKIWQD